MLPCLARTRVVGGLLRGGTPPHRAPPTIPHHGCGCGFTLPRDACAAPSVILNTMDDFRGATPGRATCCLADGTRTGANFYEQPSSSLLRDVRLYNWYSAATFSFFSALPATDAVSVWRTLSSLAPCSYKANMLHLLTWTAFTYLRSLLFLPACLPPNATTASLTACHTAAVQHSPFWHS